MGVLTRHIKVPDLWNYEREFYADGTEKHIFCEGARYHVLSYSSAGRRCSEPKCEYNQPDEKRIDRIIAAVDEKLRAAMKDKGHEKAD